MSQDKPRTPEEIVRGLQEKLHLSAKRQPARRFHQLYDKVASPWFLYVAWRRVRANKGAPGPDGVTIEMVETLGVERLLESLSRELRERTYRAGPVRRHYVPKPNGKMRPLGIPNVRDRVVQASAMLVLSPIFEADLPDTAYGFRPGRNTHQAMERIRQHLLRWRTEVVDADLSGYFDTIPHGNLLRLVARRVVDRGILNLVKQWLRAPIIEPDDPPGSAGKRNDKGTPQGGVISPMLANLYHACIPHLWETRGHAQKIGGDFVSYADDFVILLRPGRGPQALAALRSICERLSLTLNEEKTRIADAVREGFQFLGFAVRKVRNPKSGKWFPRVTPAPKNEQKVRDTLRKITHRKRGARPVDQIVTEMNQVLRGWGGYFLFGHPQTSMARINHFAEQRLRKWLMRRRQKRGPGYKHYPTRRLYDELGLHRLPTARPVYLAKASG